ncbi:FecR family protein [Hephaestia sp. GCM10023244]|uniref:FecR family protein n=1 Tax=unclassified Hephaestia TaxID=2631281 RepID=UPI002076DCB9|nr:FecR domain-containing protein [Hephaestia sp. MAHUQ-44]MCM8730242.1 FecR domain-containing protein [Hephaestia sp. MAHUQ-44]
MSAPSDLLRDTARLWAIRVADPAFGANADDWDGFTDWLAADPAHAAAYDAVADEHAATDALFDVPPAPLAAPVDTPGPSRRRFLWLGAGGAVAAALAVTLGLNMTALDPSQPYTVATEPGARRTIDLADGSRIELNGDTRIVLDKAAPRFASLEHGEAMFHVRHDDSDPFVVMVGGDKLVDAGTAFDVMRTAQTTRVQVAEGKVIYNPDLDKLALDAGATLLIEPDGVTLGRMTPGDIGGWRTGTLVYAGAALATVAADLSRSLGRPIDVAPAIAAQRFTGTLALGDGKAEATLTRIAPLLGVVPEAKGEGWMLTSPNRAYP